MRIAVRLPVPADPDRGRYEKKVYVLPKILDEKVARLHLGKLWALGSPSFPTSRRTTSASTRQGHISPRRTAIRGLLKEYRGPRCASSCGPAALHNPHDLAPVGFGREPPPRPVSEDLNECRRTKTSIQNLDHVARQQSRMGCAARAAQL
jgi:hypothetical protein